MGHNSEAQGYTTQLGEIGCKGSGPFMSWSNVSLGFFKCMCHVPVLLVLSAHQVLQNRRRHSAVHALALSITIQTNMQQQVHTEKTDKRQETLQV